MRLGRQKSESGFYHVMMRGVGQQIIFEDDIDRCSFIEHFAEAMANCNGSIVAWCLMDNHVHLLVKAEMDKFSVAMKGFLSWYARFFNARHGRNGHLFQGRFESEPIDSDDYLLTVVRYIHQNPQKAGMCPTRDYRWSSYGEYVGEAKYCNTDMVLAMIGGKKAFAVFHQKESDDVCLDCSGIARRLSDDEALSWVKLNLGFDAPAEIASLSKAARNDAIKQMRLVGMTAKQVQRLTGIGRGIVERIKLKDAS